jgi:hypothetical protein
MTMKKPIDPKELYKHYCKLINTCKQVPGYIYLIQGPRIKSGILVKVGMTTNDPTRRARDIGRSVPFKTFLKYQTKSEDARQDELVLLSELMNFHIKGEWYAIPEKLLNNMESYFSIIGKVYEKTSP